MKEGVRRVLCERQDRESTRGEIVADSARRLGRTPSFFSTRTLFFVGFPSIRTNFDLNTIDFLPFFIFPCRKENNPNYRIQHISESLFFAIFYKRKTAIDVPNQEINICLIGKPGDMGDQEMLSDLFRLRFSTLSSFSSPRET